MLLPCSLKLEGGLAREEKVAVVDLEKIQGGGDVDPAKVKGFHFKSATSDAEMSELSGKKFAQNTDHKIS